MGASRQLRPDSLRIPSMTDYTTVPADRLAVGIMDAARLAGVGRSTIQQSINTGQLKARKAGRRTLILKDDLQAWLNSFPPSKLPKPRPSPPRRGRKSKPRHEGSRGAQKVKCYA